MLRTIGELELRRGGGSLDRLEVESRRDHVAVRLGDNGQVQRSRLGHEEALCENTEKAHFLCAFRRATVSCGQWVATFEH